MNSKAPFNDAAREKDVAEKQRIAELQQERDRQLRELKEEQKRRREDDMKKARQQILLKHNRPALKPDDGTKPLTAEQLEERTCRVVDAQNLKELNAIRENCKRKIAALENPARQGHGEPAIERTRSPREITKIFNGLPKDRDSHEQERDR